MINPTSKITRRFVETKSGYVHVQEVMPPTAQSAKTLVMLSITSFGGVLTDNAMPQFAERGYRVLAIDLMGYGRSDKRSTEWLVEDFADNVEEVLQVLATTPDALICGHFSSWMGIEIATRQPTHSPLKALVLDGTPVIARAKREANLARAASPPIAWHEDGSHTVEYWKRAYNILHRLDPGAPLPANPDRKYREAYIALLEAISFEPGTMTAANHFDIESKLAQVNVPTLVMCSDTDWNLPHHPAMVAGIKHSTSLRLSGVHPLHELSKPQRAREYVEHIDRYLVDKLG